ncbi:hypothetical protein GGI07_005443 [Coemansia sp. Benny D115]|nr:hypothetical protein GGI07_005443 [Coemansia sp. Benny D115]
MTSLAVRNVLRLPSVAATSAVMLLVCSTLVSAHGDDDGAAAMPGMESSGALPEEAKYFRWPEESMGWALRVHLALCLVAYVFILPTAFVMELAQHRLQSLTQLAGALVGFLGIVFGWINGHLDNTYARFGWFMLALLIAQTAANLCLVMHVIPRTKRIETAYRIVSSIQFVCTYVAMVLGVIRYLNLCTHGHLGQCISHFARGSALMFGAVVTMGFMRVFGPAMLELRRPPELYESLLMMLVGLIGTLTEHNFFQGSAPGSEDTWSHKDLQHTMIGILWFAGGLLGVLMTSRSDPRNRTPIPAIIFIATGISMIIHQQDLAMSSRVHFLFGASLVSHGFAVICEITLVASGFIKDRGEPPLFQYIAPFFMCASGMTLMGSNRDMVLFLINSEIDIGTYALTLMSLCFVIFFYIYLLIDLYFWLSGARVGKYIPLDEDLADEEHGWTHQQQLRQKRQSTSSQASTLNHSDSEGDNITPHTFVV